MSYSKFNYKRIRQELNIREEYGFLFDTIVKVEPTEILLKSLEGIEIITLFSKKSRSEGIVYCERTVLPKNTISYLWLKKVNP